MRYVTIAKNAVVVPHHTKALNIPIQAAAATDATKPTPNTRTIAAAGTLERSLSTANRPGASPARAMAKSTRLAPTEAAIPTPSAAEIAVSGTRIAPLPQEARAISVIGI